jgi:hypothetical protein
MLNLASTLVAISLLCSTSLAADVSAEFAKHNTITDCWIQHGTNAHDITAWAQKHPGGAGVYTDFCGKAGPGFDNALKNQHNSAMNNRLKKECPLKGSLSAGLAAGQPQNAPNPAPRTNPAPPAHDHSSHAPKPKPALYSAPNPAPAPGPASAYSQSAPVQDDDCDEPLVAPITPIEEICEDDAPVASVTVAPVQVTNYAVQPPPSPPCTETPISTAAPMPTSTALPVTDPVQPPSDPVPQTPSTYSDAIAPAPVDTSNPVFSASVSCRFGNVAAAVLVIVAAAISL